MLQFCRRKQGRVTMFLLVFLLLISIPMIGGSANCERIRRMAASVISQIDGSDSLFSAGQSEEPRAAEVRTVNPTCPLLTAQRQELEPSLPDSRTAGQPEGSFPGSSFSASRRQPLPASSCADGVFPAA